MKTSLLFLLPVSTALAALPAVGPDYHRPEVASAAEFRDTQLPWKPASPADLQNKGAWWTRYNDPVLNDLEARGLTGSQTLRAALARLDQARAAAGQVASAQFPQVSVGAAGAREQNSRTLDNALPVPLTNTYRTSIAASWELDFFGRVRRLSESAEAESAAAAAALENVKLLLTSEIASTYFSLRGSERERELLGKTVEVRSEGRRIVEARVKAGAATDLDLLRADAELASTQAEALAVERESSRLSNALAVLVGEPASRFQLAPLATSVEVTSLPVGLPSELLERRPDVAFAERRLVSSNAQIGVAKAAFFPSISLTGSAGFASSELGSLFDTNARTWGFGPGITLPLFQGGRNRAQLARARAAYEENVALYRQSVLNAFREVQDALTSSRLLAEQVLAQERAQSSASHAASLSRLRYEGGYVSYFEWLDAQRTELAATRATTQLRTLQLQVNVGLIKALGGGWSENGEGRDLPKTTVASRD